MTAGSLPSYVPSTPVPLSNLMGVIRMVDPRSRAEMLAETSYWHQRIEALRELNAIDVSIVSATDRAAEQPSAESARLRKFKDRSHRRAPGTPDRRGHESAATTNLRARRARLVQEGKQRFGPTFGSDIASELQEAGLQHESAEVQEREQYAIRLVCALHDPDLQPVFERFAIPAFNADLRRQLRVGKALWCLEPRAMYGVQPAIEQVQDELAAALRSCYPAHGRTQHAPDLATELPGIA